MDNVVPDPIRFFNNPPQFIAKKCVLFPGGEMPLELPRRHSLVRQIGRNLGTNGEPGESWVSYVKVCRITDCESWWTNIALSLYLVSVPIFGRFKGQGATFATSGRDCNTRSLLRRGRINARLQSRRIRERGSR